MEDNVYLECVKEGTRLRVRIISNGYNKRANCQCPRDIRVAGKKYVVPASAITVGSGSAGTFFYRVGEGTMKVVDETPVSLKVYESEICCICMDADCEMVMVTCGHLCLCPGCSSQYTNTVCPLCRSTITS